jgi:hypothetical protein
MTPANHPTPKGYRRLKAGEVVKPTDLMNSCANNGTFTGTFDVGFLPARFVTGLKVDSNWILAVYRRATLWQRIKSFFV